MSGDAHASEIEPIDRPASIPVAYVAGWGRSGSTLLDRILGRVDGFVSVGELRMIWRRGLRFDASCGCGRSFSACPFWQAVGTAAFGGWDRVDLAEVSRLRDVLDRGWSTPRLIAPIRSAGLERDLERYSEYLLPLYRAILQVSGAEVVVDSSKLPSHAAILRRLAPSIDLRMIHLVRDSRGVAYSWQKQVVKDPATGERMLVYRPWSAALRYDTYNAMTQLVGSRGVPVIRVRYEDLVLDPERVVASIVRHVRPHDPPSVEFLRDRTVEMAVDHTVGGNPMRFSQGSMTIASDEKWREGLSSTDRAFVTALTAPMLAIYGYDLFGRRT